MDRARKAAESVPTASEATVATGVGASRGGSGGVLLGTGGMGG